MPVAALVLDPQQSLHHELPAGASATLTVVERGEDVDPELDGETVSPPPGAVILLDGSGLGAWKHFDGRDAEWKPIDAAVEVVPGARDVISREEFGDALIHVEFRVPLMPDDFSVDGTTTVGLPGPEAARGPLRLQDHGNRVRYRKVWVMPR